MFGDNLQALQLCVSFAIGRFVLCEHCGERYVFLETGHAAASAADRAYKADGKQLGRAAIADIEKKLRGFASQPFSAAPCAGCNRHQAFMVAAARRRAWITASVAGAVGLAIGFLVSQLQPQPLLAIVPPLVLGLGALLIGLARAPGIDPVLTPSERSRDAGTFLSDAASASKDELLAWAATTDWPKGPRGLPVSLGYWGDLPDGVPPELHTEAMLGTLRLTYNDRTQRLQQRAAIGADEGKAPLPKAKALKAKAKAKPKRAIKAPKRRKRPR